MANTLILHAGGVSATRDQVFKAETPKPEGSYYPIPHKAYVETVLKFLDENNFKVTKEQHGLAKEDERYFGLLHLQHAKHENPTYGWCLGLRNSHDKSVSCRMAAGTRVFVCDNLAFSGEVNLARRHTKHAMSDLQHLLGRAIGKLGALYTHTEERYRRYQEAEITNSDANDIVIRAVEQQAINPMDIMHVVQGWKKPEHKEFEPRTLWSLFNAMTGAHRELRSPGRMIARGEALHGLFDSMTGIVPFKWEAPEKDPALTA